MCHSGTAVAPGTRELVQPSALGAIVLSTTSVSGEMARKDVARWAIETTVATSVRPAVVPSGGIGITPFRSMLTQGIYIYFRDQPRLEQASVNGYFHSPVA